MWHLDFASAFPRRVVTSAEIAEWTGSDETFIRDKVGIHSRHFLSPDETPLDLARAAAEAGLAKAGITARDLDWLIFVTQNPDFRMPQSSALLAEALGARSNLAAFDLSLGCSGWVYALSLADSFAAREGFGAGIIVTCDPYSRGMTRTDKSTIVVFGDGAAATVFRAGGGATIGKGVYGTDGAGGMGLSVHAGGGRSPLVSIDMDENAREIVPDHYRIQMDGRAILDFMQTRVPDSVAECVLRNNITMADVDKFVFHQASKYMVELIIRRMGLDAGKVPVEIANTGNTVSSTIPITLERLGDRGQLHGNCVVCGFGVGLSWAVNVLKFS